MASIEKITTKDGERRYRVRWWHEGRRVEKWHRTLDAARAEKARAETEGFEGVARDPRAGVDVLNDYFDTWLASRLVKGRPLTPATRIGYRRLWTRTIEPTIGKRQLRAIKPQTVRDWHGALVTAKGQDQAAKAYRLLRAVLATAEADDVIRANPCKIRGAGQENAAERPLVATSLVMALAEEVDKRYRALVLLAGFGGLRTGEVLGLRRCDVDILHSEVHVLVQAQEVTGSGRTVLPPKSDAGRRTVALPSVVRDALDQHLATYTGPDSEAPIFTGPEGTPLRRATWSAAWRDAVKKTGAPKGLRPHDLRHHAATLTARMPGVTTKELMARIGHASPRAALIYQHATAERDRAIAAYLDEQIAAAAEEPKAPVVGRIDPSRGVNGGLDEIAGSA